MAGDAKVPACKTCRTRRVRCDRQQPSCRQCLNAGWQCPGTAKNFKFKIQTGPSHRAKPPHALKNSNVLICKSPLSPTDRLRTVFSQTLDLKIVAAKLSFISVYPVLANIPERLGRNAALDCAVFCVCVRSTVNEPAQDSLWRRSYIESLKALQLCISDPEGAQATETLAASLLLQMIEQSADEAGPAWLAHAQGMTRLIRHRGPSRFTTSLDLAVLQAGSGNVIFGCLARNEPCFLSDQQWTDFFTTLYPQDGLTPHETLGAEIQLLAAFAAWPNMMLDYAQVNSAATDLESLLVRLLDFHARILHWFGPDTIARFRTANPEKVLLYLGFEVAMSSLLVFLSFMALTIIDKSPSLIVEDLVSSCSEPIPSCSDDLVAFLESIACQVAAATRARCDYFKSEYGSAYASVQQVMLHCLERLAPLWSAPRISPALADLAQAWEFVDPPSASSAFEASEDNYRLGVLHPLRRWQTPEPGVKPDIYVMV